MAGNSDGFKTTEIGSIPHDWVIATLGSLFDIQQGKALSARSRSTGSPRPFLRTANVLWGRVSLDTLDTMAFTDEEARRLRLQASDLLVCEGGDIGRTAIWRGEMDECYYQNHLHRLRPKRADVVPEFFMYWMRAAFVLLGLYFGEGNMTTIPNLSQSRLAGLVVPFPPPREQRAIADVLGTVQGAIEATERVIAAARELKRSLMRHLFTYGPVPPAEAERVRLKETEIGPLPEHWQVVRLGEILERRRAQPPATSSAPSAVPFISMGLLPQDSLYATHWEPRALDQVRSGLLVREGQLLLAKITPCFENGKQGIARDIPGGWAYATTEVHALSVRHLPPELVGYYLKVPEVRRALASKMEGTTGRRRLPRSVLEELAIPFPPIPEAHLVVSHLASVDAKIAAEEKRRAALEALFRSLLRELMTGRVRVTPHRPPNVGG